MNFSPTTFLETLINDIFVNKTGKSLSTKEPLSIDNLINYLVQLRFQIFVEKTPECLLDPAVRDYFEKYIVKTILWNESDKARKNKLDKLLEKYAKQLKASEIYSDADFDISIDKLKSSCLNSFKTDLYIIKLNYAEPKKSKIIDSLLESYASVFSQLALISKNPVLNIPVKEKSYAELYYLITMRLQPYFHLENEFIVRWSKRFDKIAKADLFHYTDNHDYAPFLRKVLIKMHLQLDKIDELYFELIANGEEGPTEEGRYFDAYTNLVDYKISSLKVEHESLISHNMRLYRLFVYGHLYHNDPRVSLQLIKTYLDTYKSF